MFTLEGIDQKWSSCIDLGNLGLSGAKMSIYDWYTLNTTFTTWRTWSVSLGKWVAKERLDNLGEMPTFIL